MLEKQTCNGIDLWAKNFDFVVVACPILSSADGEKTLTTVDYVCASQLKSSDRVELVPLPYAYHAVDFFLRLEPTREILATKIRECRYLCFAIGGLIGDWPTVAALEAIRQMRPYSVWTDRVEHVVVKTSYTDRSGGRRLYRFLRDGVLSSPVMKQVQKYIISKSSLGLFHGGECLAAYGKFCKAPHLVHDIHLSVADLVSDGQFAAKVERSRTGAPLRIVYVGRALGMKGPFDWIDVLDKLKAAGVNVEATWLGDGDMLTKARAAVERLNLSQNVFFKGHCSDRAVVLESIRSADIFLFCHKTPESPRCLVEALMSGTPIVGYEGLYQADLLGNLSSQLLTPTDDRVALAAKITELHKNRELLCSVAAQCKVLGQSFSDEAVFKHRSDLIKEHFRDRE